MATLFAGSLSGADVVRIARDARRRARTQGRHLRSEDLAAVCVPEDSRSPALRRRIAIHEAGHAVVRMHFGTVPRSLSLVGSDGAGGSVRTALQAGMIEGLRSDVDAMVVPILAGRAAEEVILGAPSAGAGGRGDSDLAQATSMIATAESRLGLGSNLAWRDAVDEAGVEATIRRLYAETLMIVARHREAIKALAGIALERRVVGHAALADFAKDFGLTG